MRFPSLILASGSPRRQELISMISRDFKVEKPDVDEKALEREVWADASRTFEEKVKDLVVTLSREKAKKVASRHKESIVIGADTVVVLGDAVLGKPENKDAAFAMIRSLAGQTHRVLTGVTVFYLDKEESFVSQTKVHFSPWDTQMEEEVKDYVGQGLPLDKAGAYGIQETAGLWVDWMEGDYFNVVGLPVAKLNKLLFQMMDTN